MERCARLLETDLEFSYSEPSEKLVLVPKNTVIYAIGTLRNPVGSFEHCATLIHADVVRADAQSAVEKKMSSEDLVPVPRDTLSYAATALEGSADNGDQYCAKQIRDALADTPDALTLALLETMEQTEEFFDNCLTSDEWAKLVVALRKRFEIKERPTITEPKLVYGILRTHDRVPHLLSEPGLGYAIRIRALTGGVIYQRVDEGPWIETVGL